MKWRSQAVALFIVIAQIAKSYRVEKATVVEISENDIEIFGNFETFEKLGSDSSHVRRAFCPIAGPRCLLLSARTLGLFLSKQGPWIAQAG